MRLVVAGTPEVALPSLEALVASEHEVAAVVTRPDAPAGRGKRLAPSPVAQRATELGLEVLKPGRPRDPDFIERLTAIAPDCCPVIAYGALIPQQVLEIPRLGWANLHFSLLPRWRGAAPVQRAIMAGDTETGACVFRLVPELDAGDVFASLRTEIGDQETAGDLLGRLAVDGAGLLVRVMDELAAGTAIAEPQPTAGITLAPKLTVAEAEVDWGESDALIDHQIRGCTPAPGAWSTFRGERFKILTARPAGGSPLPPGQLAVAKRWVQVGTGGRPLELLEVQAFGKKAMRATDWARGANLTPGETLGGGAAR
ncbi:methionyl-tRNA formyltransferase [Propionibacteriaceae bacterium ES.041]|uniref:methionyl-tRNA formyltransferase n=1 Tax=Enemella evansiae TaxID=2016499 RepID=UPI000BF6D24F|nr:methionyl-tRNA formyltransferase [Enemella evansiae]PFG67279.1 methionyl-tRNA formyltransferase [Propionibacteriaceae bacterium ES.041]TDO93139.1 methionyl-tRNA formyltransferase [Enemella evansiae]